MAWLYVPGSEGSKLGIGLAVGSAYRTVCFVERDAFAAAVIVARMEESALDRAPVWDDLATFRGEPWRGRVDLVSAGFPCQPVSFAGSRRGSDDARWLWPEVARVVREVGPWLVFLENVPGLFSSGFGEVVGGLAALGLDAEWGVFSAAGVGAPHLRERVFVLAYRQGQRCPEAGRDRHRESTQRAGGIRSGVANAQRHAGRFQPIAEPGSGGAADAAHVGAAVADRDDAGLGSGGGEGGQRPHAQQGVGDPASAGLEIRDGRVSPRPLPLAWPPGPTDRDGWGSVLALDPTVEPAICGVADGVPCRVDRLRCLGNGVVPLAAAYAFRALAARAGLEAAGRDGNG
jgi:DNA (cytosine-5)-methyltransferase 1